MFFSIDLQSPPVNEMEDSTLTHKKRASPTRLLILIRTQGKRVFLAGGLVKLHSWLFGWEHRLGAFCGLGSSIGGPSGS